MNNSSEVQAMVKMLRVRFASMGIAVVNSQIAQFQNAINRGIDTRKALASALQLTIGTIGKSHGTR